MKIAVVGTGIAGLSAAWLLRRHAEVTVYEQAGYAGGHTHTFRVPGGPPVDTGFIVFNERNYPHLTAMFRHLGVLTQETDMSFSASIDAGRVEYAGDNLDTLFAQRWNLFDRSHWRMLLDIVRFNRDAKRALREGLAPELTLGQFILRGGYGDELSRRYLLPMAAAIWSCPVGAMLQFPAASFLRFFENHGLLGLMDRPRWRTVTGGSHEYVKKLMASLGERVRLDTAVTAVRRVDGAVRIWDAKGGVADYDQVVMAVHPDQALKLLAGATSVERRLLGAFRFQDNRVLLHTDATLMPKRRKVWAAWNYLSDQSVSRRSRVSVTYWMNRLQRLGGDEDYFVSLNPLQEPAPGSVVYEAVYAHPVFTREAIAAQQRLAGIQGADRLWFCGAWTGYGFHEDGLRSAVEVAQGLGAPAPWLDAAAAGRAPEAQPAWTGALAPEA